MKRAFGDPPPGVDLDQLSGLLFVIEGPDASGRSTHINLLKEWLEQRGYPVATTGLSRSRLVRNELDQAKQGNLLSPRTLSLFYATDFYDQLERVVVPALRAGSVVLSDRYMYTLMARDMVRGAELEWSRSLYSMALVPDAVYYFSVTMATLVERTFASAARLNYWQSGMDMGLSRDWYDSLVLYQRRMRSAFRQLEAEFGFETINANRRLLTIQRDLQRRIDHILVERYPREGGEASLSNGRLPRRSVLRIPTDAVSRAALPPRRRRGAPAGAGRQDRS